jgi:hypothetical protein
MIVACSDEIDYTSLEAKRLKEYKILYSKYFYSKGKIEKIKELLTTIVEHPSYSSNHDNVSTYLLRNSSIIAEKELKEEQENLKRLEIKLASLIESKPIREAQIKHTEYYEKKYGKYGVDYI